MPTPEIDGPTLHASSSVARAFWTGRFDSAASGFLSTGIGPGTSFVPRTAFDWGAGSVRHVGAVDGAGAFAL